LGQKTHPVGFRLAVNKAWLSNWYAETDYARQLHEDLGLRDYILKRLSHAGVAKVEIERRSKQIKINIHTSRPGIIIGKKGSEVDMLKKRLQKMVGNKIDISINIKEVRHPETNAQLIAENIAVQLERRIAYRRAMKKTLGMAMKLGAKGIRINCAGRLNGAEIARTAWYREGRVPLHTLRADIDFGFAEANTTFGIIGVKVWVFNGEILKKRGVVENAEAKTDDAKDGPVKRAKRSKK
jgi:small subunit ribosomal protein S3